MSDEIKSDPEATNMSDEYMSDPEADEEELNALTHEHEEMTEEEVTALRFDQAYLFAFTINTLIHQHRFETRLGYRPGL
jgi:hypothetical protein